MPRKPPPSPLQVASAAYARAVHLGTPEQVTAARTDLNEAKIRAWVEDTLEDAPPHITPSTQATLARLLVANRGEQ